MFLTVKHHLRPGQPAAPRRGRRTARRRPEVELLEERCVLDVRSISGLGNNILNPTWGSAGVALLRAAPAAYADGIDDPVVGNPARPSPRVVSNTIVDQGDADIISDRQLAAMIYAWGQFVDHDLDLTPNASPAEPFNIPVPTGDPFFDPNGTGTQVIFFNRSESVPGTGTSTSNPRQQPNEITAFLDGSMVYGSSDAVATALRTGVGGRLKTSPGADGVIGTQDDLLPFNNTTYFTTAQLAALRMGNDAHRAPDDQLFAAGDVRANENIELTSLHTLFVREHNRLAGLIKAANPGMSDEDIYQRARAIVGAEIEVITYNGWIPAVLGSGALPAYRGYNSNLNPGIKNEFSTALFRLGHSMLGDDVEFLDNNGLPVAEEIPLSEAFSNPPALQATGIGPILKYLASDPSSEVDNTIVNSVRNFLFGEPGQGGFDLASLNIQRGRDHGLPDYNTVRAAYGLPRVTAFSQITSNVDVQNKLRSLYGNVNNIDLWVGALAEDHVAGSSTGPLIRAALKDQFTRLRDGDRFWYQNQPIYLPPGEPALGSTTLAAVIARNTEINNLQGDVFFFRVSITGTVFDDLDGDGVRDRGEPGVAGETVRLTNISEDNAERVAEVTTDANGGYRFDVFNGLRVGNYEVHLLVPDGQATTPSKVDVSVPRGGINRVVNFGFRAPGSPLLAQSPSTVAAGDAGAEPLTQEMLRPIVAEAAARWQAAGFAAEILIGLGRVDVQIADLPAGYLGWSSPGVITIDSDAAGYGWFVDLTPAADEEFPASAGGPAYGRMDLLTVVAHEMGHQLGLEHSEGDDVMAETLPAGVRRVPAPGGAGEAVAPGLSDLPAAPTQLSPNVPDAPPTPNPGSPDGPAAGPPEAGVSVDVSRLMAAAPGVPATAPETLAYGDQGQPVLYPSRPLPLPAAGEAVAPLVVAEGRRRPQTLAVLDPLFPEPQTGLLEEGVLNDPAPALRPPQ